MRESENLISLLRIANPDATSIDQQQRLISDGKVLPPPTIFMLSDETRSYLAIYIECEFCGEIFRGPNLKIVIGSCDKHILKVHPDRRGTLSAKVAAF